jgi:hypothetical protein
MEHYEHYDEFLEKKLEHGNAVWQYDPPNGWPDNSRTFIEWIYDPSAPEEAHGCASVLGQNGTLHLSGDGQRFLWHDFAPTEPTDDPVTLLGFGPMGAIAAGGDLAIGSFVQQLRRHRVNLVRAWAIDQWVARCALEPINCAPPQVEGLTPFVGTWTGRSYDLWTLNPAYFNRLRTFVQQAADHGVVVQYSLFDKHGLKNKNPIDACIGHWDSSPYKAANNILAQEYLSEDIDSCPCTGEEPHSEDPLDNCRPPWSFVRPEEPEYALVAADNARFLEAVAREVGGVGNVVFELINEQRYQEDWWDSDEGEDYGEPWQLQVANQLAQQLPDTIARDAFNGRANESLLAGVADTGQAWVSPSAKIEAAQETTTGLLTGKAKPRGNTATMYGELSIPSAGSSRVTVAADVEWYSDNLRLILKQGNGDSVFVWILPGSTPGSIRLALYKWVNGQATQMGRIKTLAQSTFKGHVRMVLKPLAGTVEVYLDSVRDTDLVGSGVTVTPERACFSGYRDGGGVVPSSALKLDNFEATRTPSVVLVP